MTDVNRSDILRFAAYISYNQIAQCDEQPEGWQDFLQSLFYSNFSSQLKSEDDFTDAFGINVNLGHHCITLLFNSYLSICKNRDDPLSPFISSLFKHSLHQLFTVTDSFALNVIVRYLSKLFTSIPWPSIALRPMVDGFSGGDQSTLMSWSKLASTATLAKFTEVSECSINDLFWDLTADQVLVKALTNLEGPVGNRIEFTAAVIDLLSLVLSCGAEDMLLRLWALSPDTAQALFIELTQLLDQGLTHSLTTFFSPEAPSSDKDLSLEETIQLNANLLSILKAFSNNCHIVRKRRSPSSLFMQKLVQQELHFLPRLSSIVQVANYFVLPSRVLLRKQKSTTFFPSVEMLGNFFQLLNWFLASVAIPCPDASVSLLKCCVLLAKNLRACSRNPEVAELLTNQIITLFIYCDQLGLPTDVDLSEQLVSLVESLDQAVDKVKRVPMAQMYLAVMFQSLSANESTMQHLLQRLGYSLDSNWTATWLNVARLRYFAHYFDSHKQTLTKSLWTRVLDALSEKPEFDLCPEMAIFLCRLFAATKGLSEKKEFLFLVCESFIRLPHERSSSSALHLFALLKFLTHYFYDAPENLHFDFTLGPAKRTEQSWRNGTFFDDLQPRTDDLVHYYLDLQPHYYDLTWESKKPDRLALSSFARWPKYELFFQALMGHFSAFLLGQNLQLRCVLRANYALRLVWKLLEILPPPASIFAKWQQEQAHSTVYSIAFLHRFKNTSQSDCADLYKDLQTLTHMPVEDVDKVFSSLMRDDGNFLLNQCLDQLRQKQGGIIYWRSLVRVIWLMIKKQEKREPRLLFEVLKTVLQLIDVLVAELRDTIRQESLSLDPRVFSLITTLNIDRIHKLSSNEDAFLLFNRQMVAPLCDAVKQALCRCSDRVPGKYHLGLGKRPN
ncbi:hypothetical protein Ciccas_001123 [Cichlidogyrus casuarinus]|uniref:Protein MMS22-like n=1 Tax=Cichlidogyrus casuarinus TaxID=1844966 RepID=A0ABD2QL21_9PLAT